MAKCENYANELLYIFIFIAITLVSKPHIDNFLFDIAVNVIFIILSIWYVCKLQYKCDKKSASKPMAISAKKNAGNESVHLYNLPFTYAKECKLLSIEKLFFQLLNGVWSSIIILLTVLTLYRLIFNLDGKLVFNKNIIIGYILFQTVVAIAEELVFRECFYKIFSRIHMNIAFNLILVSFLFGLWHFYLHDSYTQFVSSFALSLILFFLKFKIKNFTLTSCMTAHFIYDILCFSLVFS